MLSHYDADYAAQLASWLDEDLSPHDDDSACVAVSELRSWKIDRCVKGGASGHHIAAYLGKAEPNDYLTVWGKTKRNHLKQRRRCKGGEGPVEGTSKHHYRWVTSLAVGRAQRDRNGFYVTSLKRSNGRSEPLQSRYGAFKCLSVLSTFWRSVCNRINVRSVPPATLSELSRYRW